MMKKYLVLILLTAGAVSLSGCRGRNVRRFAGTALGTTYSITYVGAPDKGLPDEVDSVLRMVEGEFSIFDSNSAVSKINRGETAALPPDLEAVLNLSQQVSRLTGGAFDCTLHPLTELWGFGHQGRKQVAPASVIDSVKRFVGFGLISVENHRIVKADPRVTLDFNAIAKGFAVDKVSQYLEGKGIADHLVEIGGEVMACGTKNGRPWKIGIQTPTETADGALESDYVFGLSGRAVATSGDYRNYFESDGVRYAHIIDPSTGRPKQSKLLSVTVVADNCAAADAFATAFMVLGADGSKALLDGRLPYGIGACFISADGKSFRIERTENFP